LPFYNLAATEEASPSPNSKMPKRFLNVEYAGTKTRINITGAERLGEVRRAIKAEFANGLAHVDAPQLQLFDQENKQITDLDDIPRDYFLKARAGGLFLVVHGPLGQEPSPVESARPSTPEEEKHAQRLLSYIFKTDAGSCVTVFDRHLAVTYAHGSHSKYKVGDIIKISPLNGVSFIDATVVKVSAGRDYIRLHSQTALCETPLNCQIPRRGAEYVQIGLSGRPTSPVMHSKGFILNDDFMKNKGFLIGSGSSPGDSGCGIFHPTLLALYGMGTASMKEVKTNFEKQEHWGTDVGAKENEGTDVGAKENEGTDLASAMNQLSLAASHPPRSYICPSVFFYPLVAPEEPPRKKTKVDRMDEERAPWYD